MKISGSETSGASRIDRVTTQIIDVPTIRPHVLSMATMSVQSMVLVRILCADGIEGIGEGTTIGGLSYGEESPESIKLTIDTYFKPVLVGGDAARPAALMLKMGKVAIGNHFAKCAIETALLDASAQRMGVPLSELLGGRVHDRIPVLWTLASGDTARDIAEAKEMLDRRRHDAFKLKIGKRPLEDDIAHVAAIKRALGDRASIRVDANQSWSETTACKGIAMLADAGIDLVEQPIARSNRAGMARLRARSRIPIMADEGLKGSHDAFAFAADAAADIFAVKIAQSGGLMPARAVGCIGEAAGIGLYGGTMLEGGIGTAASAHLFATFGDLPFGTELFGPLLLTHEILAEPLDYSEFSLKVPDGPGLGVALDEAALAHFARDVPRRTIVDLAQRSGG